MSVHDLITRLTKGRDVGLRYTSTSAMTWVVGLVAAVWVPGVPGVYFLREQPVLAGALLGLMAIPLAVACGVLVYFVRYDPDRLHSEGYQLRRKALDMIDRKGRIGKEKGEAAVAIADPYPSPESLPALEPTGDEE